MATYRRSCLSDLTLEQALQAIDVARRDLVEAAMLVGRAYDPILRCTTAGAVVRATRGGYASAASTLEDVVIVASRGLAHVHTALAVAQERERRAAEARAEAHS